MADVLIVCVREDEPQAKALADMFEAAGFSIGGAPSNDGALRSSGAGVVVWSQASIRSRPFLDAAQRVINAGKAVVASLIEPPPPSSIGSSPAFDLSEWDGDPNDPALDPLFFAVDRMVNAARAQVGATAQIADPQTYEAPAPRTPRAPAPTPQRSTYRAPRDEPTDDISSETEYWRAIRDSRDPSDFMDYLARFGPDGAFAEVAELRLKQLTDATKSRAPAPRGATPRAPTAMPSSRPMARQEAPRIEPPVRRADPPPPRRAPAPAFDRGYDRPPADLTEPLRRHGSTLRLVVLVALLVAALGGGLYFGGGLDGFGGSGQQQADNAATQDEGPPPAPSEEPASYDPDNFTLSEATAPPPTTRREPPRETQRQPTQTAQPRAAPQEAEPATPAPTTSWAGGPVSLNPGQVTSPPAATTSAPALPEPAPTQVASAEPDVTAPTTTPVRTPTLSWAQRPTARRISELYPERALRANVGGRVQLDCTVLQNFSVACSVASETPANMGFGRAALSAASSYRAQAWRSDGSSAVGARTRIVINFQAQQ